MDCSRRSRRFAILEDPVLSQSLTDILSQDDLSRIQHLATFYPPTGRLNQFSCQDILTHVLESSTGLSNLLSWQLVTLARDQSFDRFLHDAKFLR